MTKDERDVDLAQRLSVAAERLQDVAQGKSSGPDLYSVADLMFQAAEALLEPDPEVLKLRADIKHIMGATCDSCPATKDFADLWYFVMDEAPLEFERIVSEWAPSRWLDQASKLRAEKRRR